MVGSVGSKYVRDTDPTTSKEAAAKALRRVDLGLYQRMLVLAEAFPKYTGEDFCQDELANYYLSVHTDDHVHTFNNVRRRTTDLEQFGYIVVTGRKKYKGTSRQTYAITDLGLQFSEETAGTT